VTPPRLRFAALTLSLACAACQPLSDLGFDRRPVYITEPIDGTTRGRLLNAVDTPEACATWLAGAGLSFRPVADRTEDTYCQVTGAGSLIDAAPRTDAVLAPARPMMACDLAAAVAIWRRQSVEPAARALLGTDVRQIDHLGVYACRGVGDPISGRPSAHARAQAIDSPAFAWPTDGASASRRIGPGRGPKRSSCAGCAMTAAGCLASPCRPTTTPPTPTICILRPGAAGCAASLAD